MANYTRFSPSDWSTSNMSHFNSADNARNNSERIRSEAVRLMREREDRTVLTQRDADRRLGERLHDVTFWRSELQVRTYARGPSMENLDHSNVEREWQESKYLLFFYFFKSRYRMSAGIPKTLNHFKSARL